MSGLAGLTVARRWLPWLVALALLAFLVSRVEPDSLLEALGRGPWLILAAYIVLEVVVSLPVDAFGTREGLAAAGIPRPWSEVLLARGASYLLGLLSYVAGQGGIGFYLARTGVPVGRSAGAVLLLLVANGIVLVVIGAVSLGIELVRGSLEGARTDLLLLTIAAALAGTLAYLGVIALRPKWLERFSFFAPLFEAGFGGHVRAILARFPHMLLLVLLHWGAFRVWGIAVPLVRGLALNPIVLLIAALPVAPGGLGTTQTLQVLFFGPWADAPTPDGRAAVVLAFSLVHHVIGLVVQAVAGLVCLMVLRRREA